VHNLTSFHWILPT